jgi:hypothetical protein
MSVTHAEVVDPTAAPGVSPPSSHAPTLTVQPSVAPYHPPPNYPPPGYGRSAPTDGRALTSLGVAILGIVLALPLGVPGLILGPLAYFLGKSAVRRIDGSAGALGGRGLAAAGWVLGVVATALGALVSLAYLVLILLALSTPPS